VYTRSSHDLRSVQDDGNGGIAPPNGGTTSAYRGCTQDVVTTVVVEPVQISCIRNVNVTLDGECGATVTPEMVIRGTFACVDEFVIDIDDTGTAEVDGCGDHDLRNRSYRSRRIEIYTCWGNIFAEDKTAPVVECPPNTDQVNVPWDFYSVTGALEESDASFAMNDFSCYSDVFDPEDGEHYYDVITFTPTVTGNYTFITVTDPDFIDAKAALYEGALDPDHFCDGIIAQNGGVFFGDFTSPFDLTFPSVGRFIFPLEAGQTYSYVVSSVVAEATGDWEVIIFAQNPDLIVEIDEPNVIEFAPSSEYSVTIDSDPLTTDLLCTDVDEILFPNTQSWIADADGTPNAGASIAAGYFRNVAEVLAFIDKMALTGIPVP
jgi:hypothetical protein